MEDWKQRYGNDIPFIGDGKGLASARNAEIVKSETLGGGEEVITYRITTSDTDRSNDRVSVAGGKLENYAANPVLLWAHNHEIPAIGNGKNLRADGEALLADAVYHGIGQFAIDVRNMAKAGILKAVSIGFIPLAWVDEQKADTPYPSGWWREGVRTYTEWELLEFSLCNVPMNPFALQNAVAAKAAKEFGIGIRRALDEGIIKPDSEYFRRLFADLTTQSAAAASEFIFSKNVIHIEGTMNKTTPTPQPDTQPKQTAKALDEATLTEIHDRVQEAIAAAVVDILDEYPDTADNAQTDADDIAAAAAQALTDKLGSPPADAGTDAPAPDKSIRIYYVGSEEKKGARLSKQTRETLTKAAKTARSVAKDIHGVLKETEEILEEDDKKSAEVPQTETTLAEYLASRN